MAKGSRYSLIFEEENGNKIYLQTESKRNSRKISRKKFPLTQIDAFTTRLKGDNDLRLLFEYMLKEELEDGNFYVEYVQDGKKKKLKVVYKENETLSYFSNSNIGKTYIEENTKYETYVINLLHKLTKDSNLYNYLIEGKFINKYVLEKIENYIIAQINANQELITYTFKEVKKALTNYRIIRNIEDCITEYNQKKAKGETVIYKGQYRLF